MISGDFYYNTVQRICQHLNIEQLYIQRDDSTAMIVSQEKADRCLRVVSIAMATNEWVDCKEFINCEIYSTMNTWKFETFVEMIYYAAIQTMALVSTYFQLHCPIQHIAGCNNDAWKRSLQFEQVSTTQS